MKDYKYAVFIGRFQPFHNGHLQVVKHGLTIAEKVIIIVGSMAASPSTKNPFGCLVRQQMIKDTLIDDLEVDYRDVIITSVRDYYYNENAWLRGVQAKTDAIINEGDSVALLGSFKDRSSYYLRMFPQWDFESVKTADINSTDIREAIFSQVAGTDWEGKASPPIDLSSVVKSVSYRTFEILQSWVASSKCAALCKEWKFQKEYKEAWASAPFPPVFVTVDAVVTCSGHVLVIERGRNPGKGLYALPGGFLKPTETTRAGALRELKEETGIRVDKVVLDSRIAGQRLFDFPDRDPRGRTLTHAFHIDLGDGKLPEVKGSDDASRAFWMPLFDVIVEESGFYGDHAHIINNFIGAQGER